MYICFCRFIPKTYCDTLLYIWKFDERGGGDNLNEIGVKGSRRYTKVTRMIIRTIEINWNVVALLFVWGGDRRGIGTSLSKRDPPFWRIWEMLLWSVVLEGKKQEKWILPSTHGTVSSTMTLFCNWVQTHFQTSGWQVCPKIREIRQRAGDSCVCWENMIYDGTTLIEMLHHRPDDWCVFFKIVVPSLICHVFVICLVIVTAYLTG